MRALRKKTFKQAKAISVSRPLSIHVIGLEHFEKIIEKYPPLTHEEEALLAEARDNGDEGAIDTLVLHNMQDLVRKVAAKKWQNASDIHDLFMHAMQGMRKAAVKWKPVHDPRYKKPARFMHYSYWYVKADLSKYCEKFGLPHISLDAPRGDDDNQGLIESHRAEGAEDDFGFLDLECLESLSKDEREVLYAKLINLDETEKDLPLRFLPKAIRRVVQFVDYSRPLLS